MLKIAADLAPLFVIIAYIVMLCVPRRHRRLASTEIPMDLAARLDYRSPTVGAMKPPHPDDVVDM